MIQYLKHSLKYHTIQDNLIIDEFNFSYNMRSEQEVDMATPDYERAIFEAKNLLNNDKTLKDFPINLANVLENLNLKAEYSNEIENKALLDPLKKMIYIKDDDLPMKRKLFSVAHEIGHWVLHSRDKKRPRKNYDDIENDDKLAEEKEANAFAAELLMPYSEVRKLIMLSYGIADLADYFNVSYAFSSNRYNFIINKIF